MHPVIASILPNDLVFDVGANIGNKTQVFLGRGANVIAVEPQPAMIAVLEKRFAGNPNLTIVPLGLADKPGRLTMHISKDQPFISTFDEKWQHGRFEGHTQWDTKAEIDITTLDNLFRIYGIPRFVKIDVEGFEQQVIAGLSHVCPLSFEFVYERLDQSKAACDRLKSIGYKSFNTSFGESDDLVFQDGWLEADYLIERLHSHGSTLDPLLWGDIYAT